MPNDKELDRVVRRLKERLRTSANTVYVTRADLTVLLEAAVRDDGVK